MISLISHDSSEVAVRSLKFTQICVQYGIWLMKISSWLDLCSFILRIQLDLDDHGTYICPTDKGPGEIWKIHGYSYYRWLQLIHLSFMCIYIYRCIWIRYLQVNSRLWFIKSLVCKPIQQCVYTYSYVQCSKDGVYIYIYDFWSSNHYLEVLVIGIEMCMNMDWSSSSNMALSSIFWSWCICLNSPTVCVYIYMYVFNP